MVLGNESLETAEELEGEEHDAELENEDAGGETTDEGDTPSLDSGVREDLEKRFGPGKTDQEYTKLAYDYATNIERESQRKANEVKELNDLIGKIGGVDILKRLATNDDPLASVPSQLRGLIQAGELDPTNPKDALLISAFKELDGLKNRSVELDVRTAVSTFEEGLESKIATKYPDADLESIRGLAYAGAFKEVPDEEFWGTIERIAKNQQARIDAAIAKRGGGNRDLILRNKKRSIITGRTVRTSPDLSPKEAFDQAYDKAALSDDD